MNKKVILYIAMSIDGYIATKNDELDFLSLVEEEGEDYGYAAFTKTVDTVIMGRKTYEKVLSFGIAFPHAGKECYVITKSLREDDGSVHFYRGNLPWLISDLKSKQGKNIFIDGGAETVHALLNDKLIDEMIISIIPVLLGNGIKLFKDERPEQKLKLVSSKAFNRGLVQLHYICQ